MRLYLIFCSRKCLFIDYLRCIQVISSVLNQFYKFNPTPFSFPKRYISSLSCFSTPTAPSLLIDFWSATIKEEDGGIQWFDVPFAKTAPYRGSISLVALVYKSSLQSTPPYLPTPTASHLLSRFRNALI